MNSSTVTMKGSDFQTRGKSRLGSTWESEQPLLCLNEAGRSSERAG